MYINARLKSPTVTPMFDGMLPIQTPKSNGILPIQTPKSNGMLAIQTPKSDGDRINYTDVMDNAVLTIQI